MKCARVHCVQVYTMTWSTENMFIKLQDWRIPNMIEKKINILRCYGRNLNCFEIKVVFTLFRSTCYCQL